LYLYHTEATAGLVEEKESSDEDETDRSNSRAARKEAKREMEKIEAAKAQVARGKEEKQKDSVPNNSDSEHSFDDSFDSFSFDQEFSSGSSDFDADLSEPRTLPIEPNNFHSHANSHNNSETIRSDVVEKKKETIVVAGSLITARQRAQVLCYQCRDGYYRGYGKSAAVERNEKSRRREKRLDCEGEYDVQLKGRNAKK
jgi:hypothetical protein